MSTAAQDDVLVRCEGVGKKFCKSLKRSLAYGALDSLGELIGKTKSSELRKDEFWALQDVSFELRRGECLGLIGHNGAGKSTLLKMLNGLIKPDTGRIEMRGRVGALIELSAGFSPILTGRENIYNKGAILGFSTKEIDGMFDAIVDFAEVGGFLDTPVQNYSSGMKVRLGFAVSAQMRPDILLIDEVLAVGDAQFRVRCYNVLSEMLQSAAVIFVSHSMDAVSRICSRAILLNHGQQEVDSNDTGGAITTYLNIADNAPRNIIESKEITFERFFFEATGDQDISVDGICDIDMVFSINVEIPIAQNLTIRVAIWDREVKPILEVVPDKQIRLLQRGRTEIRVVANGVSLLGGRFCLSFTLKNESSAQIYLRATNLGCIRSEFPAIRNAGIFCNGSVSC